MVKYRKIVQYFILAAVLLVGGYAIGNSLFTTSAALSRGDKPPTFNLVGLDNQAHDLKQYAGKPLVLNFWGTFCPPCRNEMPDLQRQYDKWKDQGLQVVGINVSEDKLTVQRFLDQVDVNFPILLDKERLTEKKFGLKQYPTTFFIDAHGKIQDVVIGELFSEQEIETRVERLIRSAT